MPGRAAQLKSPSPCRPLLKHQSGQIGPSALGRHSLASFRRPGLNLGEPAGDNVQESSRKRNRIRYLRLLAGEGYKLERTSENFCKLKLHPPWTLDLLIPKGQLKMGWKWEALTVFLVSLFSLTRRYKSIFYFLTPPSDGLGVKPELGREAWQETGLFLLGCNFSYFGSKLPGRANRPSVDVFGGHPDYFQPSRETTAAGLSWAP